MSSGRSHRAGRRRRWSRAGWRQQGPPLPGCGARLATACSSGLAALLLGSPLGAAPKVVEPTGVFGEPGYYTTAPCRVFDSRLDGGPLVDGVPVVVAVGGVCGVPAAGHVVALNLTAITPTAAGELTVYPADSAASPLATISFSAGRTRANNALAGLSPSGELAALGTMVGGGSLHLAIDVVGWFDAATETAPDSGTTIAGRARFAPAAHATPPTLTLEPLAHKSARAAPDLPLRPVAQPLRHDLLHLAVAGEAPGLLLREDHLTVEGDLEDAAPAPDQLRLDPEALS